ncbi:hypothetical protein D3C80_1810140 [compost metagenome]
MSWALIMVVAPILAVMVVLAPSAAEVSDTPTTLMFGSTGSPNTTTSPAATAASFATRVGEMERLPKVPLNQRRRVLTRVSLAMEWSSCQSE